MKQISQVFDALNEGGETSDQIASMTGLPIGVVSSYLNELADDGLARRVRRYARRFSSRGQASHLWAPVSDNSSAHLHAKADPAAHQAGLSSPESFKDTSPHPPIVQDVSPCGESESTSQEVIK